VFLVSFKVKLKSVISASLELQK